MSELEFKYLRYEKEGKIAWITLNRPEKLNALNREAWYEIYKAIEKAEIDDGISVIVITGSGRAFCAGYDISEFPSLYKNAKDAYVAFFECLYPTFEKILSSKKLVVAAVNGLAYGGGCELVMVCDLVIASEDARFAQPEGRLGIIAPMASVFGPSIIDRRKLSELLFTGNPISSNEAERIGLVNKVVPSNRLKDAVKELVESIDTSAPIALSTMKKIMNKHLINQLRDLKEALSDLILITFQTEDFKEGVDAFLNKRKAQWKGK
ncbi:MAG: enoyl-CoA hydratase/isomerase family protein [Nitrososphaerota archaeon]|nr:enoyl-CoA hydratase/isomerase family protein [Nitrososphaerota archaeon]